MIQILIDHNSDKIILNYGYKGAISIPITGSVTQIEKLLIEVLNCVGSEFYTYRMTGDGIRLISRNEDKEVTIEEW